MTSTGRAEFVRGTVLNRRSFNATLVSQKLPTALLQNLRACVCRTRISLYVGPLAGVHNFTVFVVFPYRTKREIAQ